jgi:hypothetical protein
VKNSESYTLTYEVCNRCENPTAFVAFGLESPIELVSPLGGTDYESAGGIQWNVAVSDGNPGQQPAWRAIVFTSSRTVNSLSRGECDTFSFTVRNWFPEWQQTLLMNAGAVYDLFVNVEVGHCLYTPPCPQLGFAADCTQCEDSSEWTWWCVPDGSEYTLVRIVPADEVPTQGHRAGTVDANGYQLTCDCQKERVECCENCYGGVCNDADGTCECIDDVQPDSAGCCPVCTDQQACCYNDGQYCSGNGLCVDGVCECIERADGTTYTGDACETPITTYSCGDFECTDCANADWAVEGGCVWCAGAAGGAACVSKTAFTCASAITECYGGIGAFAPGDCPNNCSGNGYCNTTTGLCICKNGVSGLNCGSRNGLTAGNAAAIAGGALAGVIIGALCLGIIIFAVITFGGYKGIDWLARDAFANAHMHDSPIYEKSNLSGDSPIYSPNDA